MIHAAVYQAILDRLKADTGAGGLYFGNAWNLITGAYAVYGSPEPVTGPYLVYTVRMQEQHTTVGDEYQCVCTMRLYASTHDSTSSEYIATTIIAAMDRIHGNAVLRNGRVPTYGFNRHLLVLPTNTYSAVGGGCICTTYDVEQIDEHTAAGTVEIAFRIAAIAANP
jgi:hypothetical protein